MSLEPEGYQEGNEPYPPPYQAAAAERTTLPGVFLIIVGVLNLLLGGFLSFLGWAASKVPTEEFRAQLERQQPGNLKQMEEAGWTIQNIKDIYLYGGGIGGGVAAILALVIILGGIMMCMRKGYGLAVLGSILAAIPCLSLSACPCLFGMGIGIWALAVLFNADVKAAFR